MPASATAPVAQTMPAALRGFSFTFHVFGAQHIVGGDYPIRVDCNDFNDPYRNPGLHAHPGWHCGIAFAARAGKILWGICSVGSGTNPRLDSISLGFFLYDRTLQERCGGLASGRGFQADECRQDHRPVSCKGGGRMEPPLYSKCEDCREDNPAKQELKRALLNWRSCGPNWCENVERVMSRLAAQEAASGSGVKVTGG